MEEMSILARFQKSPEALLDSLQLCTAASALIADF
jgi:hypothetical protein